MSQQLLTFAESAVYDAFLDFYRANPSFYLRFRDKAMEAMRAGYKKYSAYRIVEIVRWDYDLATVSTDGFKINNNTIPFFSRLLALREPEQFAEFFEFRTSKHAVEDAILLRDCRRIDSSTEVLSGGQATTHQ